MYTAFFNLTRMPFNMTPDPAMLFMTDQHREALAGLTYAILDRKGFLALSGMAGAGKTTPSLRGFFQKIPADKVRSSVILNPTLTPSEFLELAMLDFGIQDVPASKAQRLFLLQRFLLQAQREGKTCVLIIDEAHKLSSEVLEEIRLLGNLEWAEEKLLQVVLIGQSELDEVLSRPELWQFKQRISVRLSLKPLGTHEIGAYIEHRWRVAGAKEAAPFSSEAIHNVAKWSRGIPRLINSICDNALVEAFAESTRSVSGEHVRLAAGGLLLIDNPMPPRPFQVPAPERPVAPKIVRPLKLTTLDRYAPRAPKPSFFSWWTRKAKSV